MIDWVSAVLTFPHHEVIHGGGVIYINEDGSESRPIAKKRQVEGSHSAKCAIQSDMKGELGQAIYISGSPKFLQGHNLFGTDNPCVLAAYMAEKVLKTLGLPVDPFRMARWKRGDGVKLTRVDCTYMLDVGSEMNASAWLEAAAASANMKYRGRGENRSGTLYFGKHSRRWALKLYKKFVEINSRSKSHALPETIEQRENLLEYARGTVRAELTLQSMELKRRFLSDGKNWNPDTAYQQWEFAMKTLEISSNLALRDDQSEKLPRKLRGTYSLWKQGQDMHSLLSRPTFYRHRRELLAYQIDIASRPVVAGASCVVPLVRYIEARPKPIPSWAFNTSLLLAA